MSVLFPSEIEALPASGTPAYSQAVASGGAAGGSALATAGVVSGPIGAAISGVTLLIGLWLGRKGPKQKEQASNDANQAEYYLKQNLAVWQSSSKSAGEQAAALSNFDQVWASICQQWQQLGEPGQRAINERGPGGTVPGTGGNWFVWYRDPIANDTTVSIASGLIAGAGISSGSLLLFAALGLAALYVFGGGGGQ